MESAKKAPAGAVRQLQEDDLSKKLVGWKPASTGTGGLVNERGLAMLRVVVQKVVDGDLRDVYDQPLFVENAGAIVACQAGEKIGLVQNYRFTGERLMDAGKDFVRRLDAERRWDELLATLGRWEWELPRGLSQLEEETDLEKFVLATAKAEALEESGFGIADARVCGRLNANTTLFAHSQYVVKGRVVSRCAAQPEELEMVGQTTLFDMAQIRVMVDTGVIQDGLTLAGLTVAGFRF